MSAVTDVKGAFDRVANNTKTLSRSTVEQRIERIKRLVDVTLKHQDEIYAAVARERDISTVDIDGELLMIKTEAEFICKNLEQWMQAQPVQGSLMSLGKKAYIHYEAKGVVLVLCTWNAPYAIAFVPAIAALAAGNGVIIKPSELAPHSSSVIKKIVEEACEPDVVSVLEGDADVAQELLAQPFHHVFYIGGHHVGKLIAKAAAEQFASYTLEMGGKNPTIVDASADVADAATKTAWGRMGNCGQMCVSPDYVMVHESIADEFIAKVKSELDRMYDQDGKGAQQAEEFGRIINDRHWARVKGLLDDALDKGATLLHGGETDASDRYIAPTVITGVTDDMKIQHEEIFGPVMVIKTFSSRDEVENEVAKHPKPLSAYLYAKDRDAIDWFLASTTAGNSVINHNVIQSGTNPNLPFGGVGASGTGRIGGFASFAECSNARSVVEEGPAIMDPLLFFPPYSDKYRKMIKDSLAKSYNVPNAMISAINGVIALKGKFSRN